MVRVGVRVGLELELGLGLGLGLRLGLRLGLLTTHLVAHAVAAPEDRVVADGASCRHPRVRWSTRWRRWRIWTRWRYRWRRWRQRACERTPIIAPDRRDQTVKSRVDDQLVAIRQAVRVSKHPLRHATAHGISPLAAHPGLCAAGPPPLRSKPTQARPGVCGGRTSVVVTLLTSQSFSGWLKADAR